MYRDNDVSYEPVTRWKRTWWIRIDDGSSMRNTRGRRRVWRAKPKRQRGRNGKEERKKVGPNNAVKTPLFVVLHLPTAGATAATRTLQ